MKFFLCIFIFILSAFTSFAQNAKIKKLAKKHARIICNCPSMGMIETFSTDFRDKKITQEEFMQGIKFAYMEMEQCMRTLQKKLSKLSPKEFEFLVKESERYRLEICPFVENKK